MDLTELYNAASAHRLTSIVACVLKSSGIENRLFAQAKLMEEVKIAILDQERERIISSLTEAKIWCMPLKGVFMRKYYPRPDMRQMADNDLLFDASRDRDVQKIMGSLGFSLKADGISYHDSYWKAPFCHMEMHRALFSSLTTKGLYRYYENIRNKLIGDGYELHFSHEDFYIYMIAHDYKHYYSAGLGLRALLDIYVFRKRFNDELNWDYIHTEMKKIGIDEFEYQEHRLACKLFSPGSQELTKEEEIRLEYYLKSGTFGTAKQKVEQDVNREGKIHYVFRRLLFPYKHQIEEFYPFFYKHKILYPVLPVYRLFRGWKKAIYELKLVLRGR